MIKLINDDCLNEMKKIPDESIDSIITDPPYLYLKNQKFDKEFNEIEFFNNCKRILKKDGFIVIFGRGESFYRWNTVLSSIGFKFKEEIIWNKRHNSTIHNPISRIHETISIFTKNKGKLKNIKIPYIEARKYDLKNIISDIKRINSIFNNSKSYNDLLNFIKNGQIKYIENKTNNNNICVDKSFKDYPRVIRCYKNIENGLKEKSIIEIEDTHYNKYHPAQKPVRLLERLINLVSDKNDIILDPFMGSGTTGVACKHLNRNFIGIELDKEYFEIAKKRIEEE